MELPGKAKEIEMAGLDETQKWYQSRSVLTGLVSVLATVLGFLGVEFGPEEQEALIVSILGLGAVIAGVASIYYRIVAKKKIAP